MKQSSANGALHNGVSPFSFAFAGRMLHVTIVIAYLFVLLSLTIERAGRKGGVVLCKDRKKMTSQKNENFVTENL